ncbi:MAG: Crp/Fnr family transcriptional regulator [Caulobacteraceae bacterium]|nr:Crp/Fnr family transcriptional regulator [Caulobacteraceae bacterium]
MDAALRHRATALLRQSPWLEGERASLIEPLIAHGRLIRLKAGQWAQSEGDDDTGLLVVVEGMVQLLCQAPGDREVLLGQAGPGVAIGQTIRFGGGPRLVTVVCAQDSLVLQVSDRALGRIAAEHPGIWEAVAALLYLQLRGLVQMVAVATALPPRQRLAARLEALARASPGGASLRLSQQALAEMIGLTRKTVNAYLGEFERAGLVRRAYGALTVLDAPGLRRIAER